MQTILWLRPNQSRNRRCLDLLPSGRRNRVVYHITNYLGMIKDKSFLHPPPLEKKKSVIDDENKYKSAMLGPKSSPKY